MHLLALGEEELAVLVPAGGPGPRMTDWPIVHRLNTIAHDLALAGRFEEALRLYDAATLAPVMLIGSHSIRGAPAMGVARRELRPRGG